MATYSISAEELLLVYLTLLGRDEEGHSEYFNQWFNSGGSNRLRGLFNSLKEKGIILKNYNPDTYILNDIEFNKNFLKSWYKQSLEMGKELWENYPNTLIVNGKQFFLREISRRFSSQDEFFFYYGTCVGHNREKHAEVLEILKWAKEQNLINFGILNFVINKQWESIKELRDNPDSVQIGTSYDIYESV